LLDNRATSEARENTRRQLRRSLECLVGIHFTEGNAITVLRNGDEIFPAMLEAIGKAQYTVDLMRRGIGRALVLDMIAIGRGRGIGRVEVTANPHALAFYENAGFVVYREVVTRFRTAPGMRLDVTA